MYNAVIEFILNHRAWHTTTHVHKPQRELKQSNEQADVNHATNSYVTNTVGLLS